MKTIEEIKNQVAKSQFNDLYENLFAPEKAYLTDLISKQCCDEQIKSCAEQFVDFTMDMNIPYGEIRDNLLNTPNVVTTKP